MVKTFENPHLLELIQLASDHGPNNYILKVLPLLDSILNPPGYEMIADNFAFLQILDKSGYDFNRPINMREIVGVLLTEQDFWDMATSKVDQFSRQKIRLAAEYYNRIPVDKPAIGLYMLLSVAIMNKMNAYLNKNNHNFDTCNRQMWRLISELNCSQVYNFYTRLNKFFRKYYLEQSQDKRFADNITLLRLFLGRSIKTIDEEIGAECTPVGDLEGQGQWTNSKWVETVCEVFNIDIETLSAPGYGMYPFIQDQIYNLVIGPSKVKNSKCLLCDCTNDLREIQGLHFCRVHSREIGGLFEN